MRLRRRGPYIELRPQGSCRCRLESHSRGFVSLLVAEHRRGPPPQTPTWQVLEGDVAPVSCGAQYRRTAGIYTDYAQVTGRSYRFDTNPTGIPIVDGILTPGFTTHSAEYAYFFDFPPGYDLY
ncbi:hypothetical protein LZ30DRAFT_779956 [Colletotrichum cereale]|nr:hypothetical protein LZ30DRAFT_779956 [Colletotrichum cereale]